MISVALATYNGEKYIFEQLLSILNCLSEEDEIIISDDGSTDDTIKIINSFHDNRIKLFEGPKRGIISNFENAIDKCSGEYIFLSDQDDIWEKNKVRAILSEFEKDEKLILIVHNNEMINANGESLSCDFFSFRKIKNGLFNNIFRNSFIGCCMCFRKKLKDEILPIPRNMPMHDQWIGLIALLNGSVNFYDCCLIKYRRHDSNNSQFERNSLPIMFKNRFIIINNLLKYKLKMKKRK